MTRKLAVAAAALVALALPAQAFAHATLQRTTPRFGTELARGPATIRLQFDQQVKVLPGAIQVLNGSGVNFAGPARSVGTDVVAPVRHLKLGAYTVRWQAVSADSHVVSGVWTFGVRVPPRRSTMRTARAGPRRSSMWCAGSGSSGSRSPSARSGSA